MPYQGLADGLYFVRQYSREKGVDHYGILDIGNRRRAPGYSGTPVILHQLRPRIRADRLHKTGTWQVLYKIDDEAAALKRVKIALSDPDYALLRHNCEHFARFVAFGVRESKQLQAAGWLTGIITLAIIGTEDEPLRPRRRKPKSRRRAA
jgi:hypothetical protein